MGHRLSQALEHRVLLRMIFNETEGAGGIETHIASLPRRFDPRRQSRQRKSLIDMSACHAETPSDLVRACSIRHKRSVGFDFIDGVHANTMDVLHEGDFPPLFQCNDVAGNRIVLRNDLVACE